MILEYLVWFLIISEGEGIWGILVYEDNKLDGGGSVILKVF